MAASKKAVIPEAKCIGHQAAWQMKYETIAEVANTLHTVKNRTPEQQAAYEGAINLCMSIERASDSTPE